MAEARGKAQADELRKTRAHGGQAPYIDQASRGSLRATSGRETCLCGPGDVIPGDGEVVEGVAGRRSAITGESAPVIRESGGDRSRSPGGTRCCRTSSSSRSPRTRVIRSSTARLPSLRAPRARKRPMRSRSRSCSRAHAHLPAGCGHPPAVRGLHAAALSRCRSSSPSWSASSRRRSADCCPPLASRAWTASSSTTSSR